ncbi:hypothetical protein HMPREF7215_0835 [Pyramidobacter piscolens W5455]|uniref:Uncharacterized protein n=1 Tax=Pyramidobacter piscolens W5455 TaxID=352165 RepID=A0ABP2HQQ6_9BACT|nr:hypothetical protein HMPREF7215_0835 [Pyramidobacter piscolens W5455]
MIVYHTTKTRPRHIRCVRYPRMGTEAAKKAELPKQPRLFRVQRFA